MNKELEKYIDMALVDGFISESEIIFLRKKAEQLGVDNDEFEFVLNYKTQIIQKELQVNDKLDVKINNDEIDPNQETNRKIKLIKCPSCGAPIESFNVKCTDCNYEFRNVEANITVSKIFERFESIEIEVRENYFKNNMDRTVYPKGGLMKEDKTIMKIQNVIELEIESACVNQKCSFISTFPIPNSKEDILEILAIGMPEAKRKLNFFEKLQGSKGRMKKAWLAKCEQIIIKARIAMKEDKKILEQIESYAKELGV